MQLATPLIQLSNKGYSFVMDEKTPTHRIEIDNRVFHEIAEIGNNGKNNSATKCSPSDH